MGALDLLVALGQGTRLGVAPLLGAGWYVPTFLVPALLVGHALGFALLAGGRRRPSPLPA